MSLRKINKKIVQLVIERKELEEVKCSISNSFVNVYYNRFNNFWDWKNSSEREDLQTSMTEIKNRIRINVLKSKHYKKLYKTVQRCAK